MKNLNTIAIQMIVRINAKVVSVFSQPELTSDLIGYSIRFKCPFSHPLPYTTSIERGILYINFSTPMDENLLIASLPGGNLGNINISNSAVANYIPKGDILSMHAHGNMVFIVRKENRDETSYRGLNELEAELESSHFIRIHTSTVIAWENIATAFSRKSSSLLTMQGRTLKISRTYKEAFYPEYERRLQAALNKGKQDSFNA